MALPKATWSRSVQFNNSFASRCQPAAPRLAAGAAGARLVVRATGACSTGGPQLTRERSGKARQAILCQRLKTHEKALTAALILNDDDGNKEFITASLDKSMALWRVNDDECCGAWADVSDGPSSSGLPPPRAVAEAVRLVPSGSPIFSFVKDGWNVRELPNRKQVFCGSMGREILAWEPGDDAVQDTVVLDGHCGWVRSLAKHKKWLFSASCSVLRQYDMTRAVPRLVREVTLDKGDILSLATGGDRIFAAVADGSIRSWHITKTGELEDGAGREKAHQDRVTAVRFSRNLLYSASHDGSIKMWDPESLELVLELPKAHGGHRVTCMAAAPNGWLFTGGDDKLVRRWQVDDLQAGEPLYCHNHSIRTLNAGKRELLISGDAGGEVAVWKI